MTAVAVTLLKTAVIAAIIGPDTNPDGYTAAPGPVTTPSNPKSCSRSQTVAPPPAVLIHGAGLSPVQQRQVHRAGAAADLVVDQVGSMGVIVRCAIDDRGTDGRQPSLLVLRPGHRPVPLEGMVGTFLYLASILPSSSMGLM